MRAPAHVATALCMLLALGATAGARRLGSDDGAVRASRVLLAGTPVKIVHVNDHHARFDPASASFGPCSGDTSVCFGGFARMATAVKNARAAAAAAGSDVLVLHAGDQFQGTAWDFIYTRSGVQVAQQPLNAIGLDAFTLGNHEFDYGVAILGGFLDALNTTAVSCNVDASKEPALAGKFKKFVVRTLPVSGLKVGIVGLTTTETAYSSSPGPNVVFNDPYGALPGCIADAKAAGAQAVIVLSHVGSPIDIQSAALPAAAGADLIIGGHSHSFFYTGAPPPLLLAPPTQEATPVLGPYPTNVANGAKTIPVVSALWGSRYLGVLDATWGASGVAGASGAPVLLGGKNSSNDVAPDPAMAAILDALRGPVDSYNVQPVGATSVFLTGPQGKPGTPDASLANPARMKETNFGNLFNDAMLLTIKSKFSSLLSEPANQGLPLVAIYNGGGIRASVPAGAIDQGGLITVSPFGNYAVVKRATAAVLLASLTNGLSAWATTGPGGRFPQVGGMRYAFDSSKNASQRLGRVVLADGREVGKDYTGDVLVACNNFMGIAPGGDGYTQLAAAPTVLDTSIPLNELLADNINKSSPISPATDGRIANCAVTPSAPLCPAVELPLKGLPAKQSGTKNVTIKPAAQRRYNASGDAANGIDGNRTTFTLTASKRGSWFEVDLNKTVTLESITLFAAALAAGEAAPNFPVAYARGDNITVRISPKRSSNSRLFVGTAARTCGVINGPLDAAGTPLKCGLTAGALPQGRYLSIQLQKPANKAGQLSFAELQVMVRP